MSKHEDLKSSSVQSSDADHSLWSSGNGTLEEAKTTLGRQDIASQLHILLVVCLSAVLSGLGLTCLASSLSVIMPSLSGNDYPWAVSSYAIANMAFIPICGDIAEVFGVFPAMMISTTLFLLGSILCGCTQNVLWLISARVVQGSGGGGLLLLPSIIIADLVPSHRQHFTKSLYLTMLIFAVSVGPLFGNVLAVAHAWRWIFIIKIPLVLVLSGTSFWCRKAGHFSTRVSVLSDFRRMDWTTDILMTVGSVLVGVALTKAYATLLWTSVHVLAPLIAGLYLVCLAVLLGGFPSARSLVPRSIMSNLTTISALVQNILISFVFFTLIYYLPVYYQGCQGSTLTMSGVKLLAIALPASLSALLAGLSSTYLSGYRAQCYIGWILSTLGCGLMTIVQADSPSSYTIAFPILAAMGCGAVYLTTDSPLLVPLPKSSRHGALVLGTFNKSLGAMAGILVNAELLQRGLVDRSQDIPSGQSFYEIASHVHILAAPDKATVQTAVGDSLSAIWHATLGVG
ncbi:hypothetical protein EIP91_007116 [Steccherinum ochraceum]|uniref:Major facilitator superfamily (MFS) profile domain-containing protein n=1 Tax=Steccherinum ochraceum TaxID=92696 RepID=A0A4V6N722_9APHY|nr:hypothetical protein EIP91_007116 [Steccherinum ochraceum]